MKCKTNIMMKKKNYKIGITKKEKKLKTYIMKNGKYYKMNIIINIKS